MWRKSSYVVVTDAVARATAIVNSQVRKQRVPRTRAPRGAAARKLAAEQA